MQQYARIGQAHWEAAGVSHKIELRIGKAQHTLQQMLADGTCVRLTLSAAPPPLGRPARGARREARCYGPSAPAAGGWPACEKPAEAML